MKLIKPKKTFKFKSYEENSHPLLYFNNIEEEHLYKEVVNELLIKCSLTYMAHKNKVEHKNIPLKKPPLTKPVFIKTPSKNDDHLNCWGDSLFWGDCCGEFEQCNNCKHYEDCTITDSQEVSITDDMGEYIEIEALPLSRDITPKDIRNALEDEEQTIDRYNSQRKTVLEKLKETGSPRLMIEINGLFTYVYVNLDKKVNSYIMYVFPTWCPLCRLIHAAAIERMDFHIDSSEITTNDFCCIFQTVSLEIEELPKEDQAKMILILLRLLKGERHYRSEILHSIR